MGQASPPDGWRYRDLYADCMAELVGVEEFHSTVFEDSELAGLFGVAFDLMVRLPDRLEKEYHLLLVIRRLCERHTT